LQIRVSQKTKGMFIGCSGWPDCDAIYPLPQGKIEAVETLCPACGMPQVKVTAFRTKPRTTCIDPACPSNQEPDVEVGICPACTDRGIMDAKLIAQRNPRTLKRFIRCENFDECGTSYPLPQYGKLTPTDEVCEACGAPMVIVTTARGPWKLCPNFNCPGKEQDKEKKPTRRRTKGTRKTRKK
ncbi:MAG: topoisomerase DNA-binding C4 zinc finger domain-containing protein, partial [Eggerthellaceae bacterium]|nr:topoisomerase DNA-binding C4 zinc finger domain-containing protein [Eggerthellaceae bacterium]